MGTRTDEIVGAALAVAAREGIGHLAMRAVAAEIGVTVMALYRHVPNKEALLDAMVGRMLSEIALPDDESSWQEGLRQIAAQMLALAHRYPTVLPLLLTRAYVSPEAVQLVRKLYALLDRAGIPQDQVFRIERMFSTFLLGYTISVANNAFWAEDPATLGIEDTPRPTKDHDGNRDRWVHELDQNLTAFFALITVTATK